MIKPLCQTPDMEKATYRGGLFLSNPSKNIICHKKSEKTVIMYIAGTLTCQSGIVYYIGNMKPVTDEQMNAAREETFSEIAAALASKGITLDFLATRLKREINAKETKFIKVKKSQLLDDAVKALREEFNAILAGDGKSLKAAPKLKIVAETTEEMIIAVNVRAWGVQQRAREDAQKLLDLYPAQKQKVEHGMEDKMFTMFVKLLPEEHQSYFVGLVKKIKEGGK